MISVHGESVTWFQCDAKMRKYQYCVGAHRVPMEEDDTALEEQC